MHVKHQQQQKTSLIEFEKFNLHIKFVDLLSTVEKEVVVVAEEEIVLNNGENNTIKNNLRCCILLILYIELVFKEEERRVLLELLKMNGLSNNNDVAECPLCMEPFEVDDLNFYPCTCGYQICRFCWHRIRTNENELCPACRKAYPENPADFTPLSQEQV